MLVFNKTDLVKKKRLCRGLSLVPVVLSDGRLVGVARYTDVTVRYDSVQQEKTTNLLCSVSFHLF